jgi:hypothetical protein
MAAAKCSLEDTINISAEILLNILHFFDGDAFGWLVLGFSAEDYVNCG